MRKIILVALSLFMITGCGSPTFTPFESLSTMQPFVLSVSPEDGSAISPGTAIDIEFSTTVDPMTVDRRSFAIINLKGDMDREEIIDDAAEGDLPGIDGKYIVDENSNKANFIPSVNFQNGGHYLIIINHGIMSDQMVPLNQNPGRANTPFVSEFYVSSDVGPDGSQGGVSFSGSDERSGDSEAAEVVRIRPNNLTINEVLYDVSGSDTDGDVFIELYGDPDADITGYIIYLVNGDDGIIKDTIKIPENTIIPDDGIYLMADSKTGLSEMSNVPDADLVDNFDPQNGPDCIQLIDHTGALVDAIGYGEPIVDMAENGIPCFEGIPAAKVSSGQSLSRTDGVDSNDNSVDFIVFVLPTPGLL